jgi:hypothetical protein
MRKQVLMLVAALHWVAPAVAQVYPMPRFPDGTTAKLVVPLGDTLNVDRIGMTIFDNKHVKYDVSDWKLGERLEISLAEIISRSGALKVEPMGDAQARIALAAANNYSNVSMFQLPKLRAAVKEYGAKSNADVLVIVNGFQPVKEQFFNSGRTLYKFGIAESGSDDSRTAIYYATLTVLFFDAHTGKRLAYAYNETRSDRGPLPDDIAQSPADLEAARRGITYLIENAVAKTVKEMIDLRAGPRD